MDELKAELNRLKALWKNSKPAADGSLRNPVPPEEFVPAIVAAFRAASVSDATSLGTLEGVGGPKEYVVFSPHAGRNESRPFLRNWIFASEAALVEAWNRLVESLDDSRCEISAIGPEEVNRTIYAATQYASCAFDMFTKNRKSAGTFFEYLTGSLILRLCRGKLGPLPILKKPDGFAVPVDVVVQSATHADALILASKITSRERIVQPFVHHLMVNKTHPGRYKTLILCASETNRIKRDPGLQETCVPGPIDAFRETLGPVDGFYYLDLPRIYAAAEFAKAIEVSTIGSLLCESLRLHYGPP